MTNNGESQRDAFRQLLEPTKDCPSPEDLARLLDGWSGAGTLATFAKHVESCAYCRTEVRLLKSFQAADVSKDEAEAVRQVTERLQSRSGEIFGRPGVSVESPAPWWRGLFASGPWVPAALAMAGVLVVIGVGLQLRHSGPPALSPVTGQDVLRSHALTIVAPSGDVREVPSEIRWEATPGAVKYEVRLLEVDRTELWKAEAFETKIALPAPVQARIVPAKTLLCQVSALDASGRILAESEFVHFRLFTNN